MHSFSVDFGLIHLIGLDLNIYYYPSEMAGYRAAQLSWLAKDLVAVDRSKTPWVVVTSHYPL